MNKTILFIVAAIVVIGAIFATGMWMNKNTTNLSTTSTSTTSSGGESKNSSIQPSAQKNITKAELAQNNNDTSCWVSVKTKVYNVTPYLPKHPGGKAELLKNCGSELDPKSMSHKGGEFTSDRIQEILKPFAIGSLTT